MWDERILHMLGGIVIKHSQLVLDTHDIKENNNINVKKLQTFSTCKWSILKLINV